MVTNRTYKFATAINCIDGRTQEPVINYLKQRFKVDYVDMITEPGPELFLTENTDPHALGALRKKIEISLVKHDSKLIALAGHYDCAANPVSENLQKQQIIKALELITSWGWKTQVIGLYVNENQQVEELFFVDKI